MFSGKGEKEGDGDSDAVGVGVAMASGEGAIGSAVDARISAGVGNSSNDGSATGVVSENDPRACGYTYRTLCLGWIVSCEIGDRE